MNEFTVGRTATRHLILPNGQPFRIQHISKSLPLPSPRLSPPQPNPFTNCSQGIQCQQGNHLRQIPAGDAPCTRYRTHRPLRVRYAIRSANTDTDTSLPILSSDQTFRAARVFLGSGLQQHLRLLFITATFSFSLILTTVVLTIASAAQILQLVIIIGLHTPVVSRYFKVTANAWASLIWLNHKTTQTSRLPQNITTDKFDNCWQWISY